MASIPADRPYPSRLAPETAATAIASTQPQSQTVYSSETSSNLIVSDSPSHYSSFSSSDSDEPLPHSIEVTDEDAAGDVVGVSIGREQSRLKARATPVEEKNRVLEHQGSYFTTIPDTIGEDGLFASELTAEPESVEPKVEKASAPAPAPAPSERKSGHKPRASYPSPRYTQPGPGHLAHGPRSDLFASAPEKAGSKDTAVSQRSGFVGNLLKNTLPRRPRAWSGEFKKFLPDLASLRKRPSLPFGAHNGQNRIRSQTVAPTVKKNSGCRKEPHRWSCVRRHQLLDQAALALKMMENPLSRYLSYAHQVKHQPRNIPSYGGLVQRCPVDRQVCGEQRPLYENVHTQVNSRFKAIKDSLQDSSSRLLSMPNLHLQDIRTDWSSRPFLPDLGNGSSNNSNGASGTCKGEQPPRVATPPPTPRNNPNITHPILEEAMAELTGDVVILGGYRGSILRSAKPPNRQLWVPMKVGLNLRKVDLEVGLNPEDEERMEETIIPSGVLSHVGPVDVCRRLMKRLRKSENALRGDMRVHDYGYDWRLSPELLSRRLIAFLESLPCNQEPAPGEPRRGATVIAHSLGGLITRHAVNERPDLFAGVVYAGVPQHCVNILGPLPQRRRPLPSSPKTATASSTNKAKKNSESISSTPKPGKTTVSPLAWAQLSPAPPTPTTLGFKDIPIIGKRFSMGPRDDSDEFLSQDLHNHPHDGDGDTGTDKDVYARHPSTSHNPAAYAAYAAEKAQNPADGLVGPGAHPRSSAATNKIATTSTIPLPAAREYLQRTLADTKRFKENLAFRQSHHFENRYPPAAVLYGKTLPTVYGARVVSRESIKQVDAYDDLAFAAGDGVCLASAAMLPPGYRIIKDGLVKSERGHVGLLGDLEGVGQCLRAIHRGGRRGWDWGEKEL
ncbi:hypothetical protein N7453_010181 [Penicillium expansum]|nr:hypothetical protein N7453_010181 [Penicillium expansum]